MTSEQKLELMKTIAKKVEPKEGKENFRFKTNSFKTYYKSKEDKTKGKDLEVKLSKSLTAELVDMRIDELPTELVGINGGMLKSNIENLTADQKLLVDKCIRAPTIADRNQFCDYFANG